jgi:signal transduction histidine kinase
MKAEFNFSRKELEFERKTLQQKWIIFSSFAALFTTLLVVLLVYRSRQKEKAANKALQQKNAAIARQKEIAEEALDLLRTTQKQLVHSEKMASLGELTAGIAHEIQNPLNFVNNFSDVSREMIEEVKSERAKSGNERNGAMEEELLNSIATNLEKIHHHGQRADAIVKAMLQHSQKSSGQKEPTDINILCDDYLRLAYNGQTAKDKAFSAALETKLDSEVGRVNVIPQDIGRVLLNLINNAFYAVSERKKNAGEGYEPLVTVSTRKLGDMIEISVADNGTGIQEGIREKIFQPFFTTKPTGQGTGLGLSLSYDILKAHGGELKVETKEGDGSAFVIQLPVV